MSWAKWGQRGDLPEAPWSRYPIGDMLLRMSKHAREQGIPLPVIEMPLWAAQIFGSAVASEMNTVLSRLTPIEQYRKERIVLMYDGIKIVARRPQTCQPAVDGWREHFGPLADIWSDQ